MNLEYLEDLLVQANDLKARDYDKATDLKIKTREALKILFPGEFVFHGDIDRIRFDTIFFPSSYETEVTTFKAAQKKLISMIEAKIDVLKINSNKKALNAISYENEIAMEKIKHLKIISELNNSNKYLQSKIDELQIQVDKLHKDVISAKKWRNKLDLGTWIALVAFIFAIGAGTDRLVIGYNKQELEDQIYELKKTIKLREVTIDSVKSIQTPLKLPFNLNKSGANRPK